MKFWRFRVPTAAFKFVLVFRHYGWLGRKALEPACCNKLRLQLANIKRFIVLDCRESLAVLLYANGAICYKPVLAIRTRSHRYWPNVLEFTLHCLIAHPATTNPELAFLTGPQSSPFIHSNYQVELVKYRVWFP